MALMDLGRKFQVYHSRKRRAMEREAKRQILMKYSTELAAGLAKLTGEDENKILRDLQELIEEKIRTGVILEEGEKEGEIEMEVIPEETEGEEELELEEVV